MLISNNAQLALPTVRLVLGICAVILSLVFSIQFVAQGAAGAGIISAIIFCLVFEFCKTVFTGDLFFYWETGQGSKAFASAILVALLFALSISAAVFCLTINPVKNETLATASDNRTETLQKSIDDKKALLSSCNPNYITKCVAPLNKQISEMESELSKTFNQSDDVINAKAARAFWEKAAKYMGTNADNLQLNFAIARATILDLLGLILISQYTSQKRINNAIKNNLQAVNTQELTSVNNAAIPANNANNSTAPTLPKYNLKW